MTSFFVFPALLVIFVHIYVSVYAYLYHVPVVTKRDTCIVLKLFFVFSVFFSILTLHLVTSS